MQPVGSPATVMQTGLTTHHTTSTTGYGFLMNGIAVSWNSQLQHTVAASSVEIEYQAAIAAVREALWVRKLAVDLGPARSAVSILMDSQGALNVARNPITYVHHHLVRERATHCEVVLAYCATENMVGDALTKALEESKLCQCQVVMGLV